MNEEHRQNLSARMKEKWIKAEEYAKILELPKEDVFNHHFHICEKYKDNLNSDSELFKKRCLQEIESIIKLNKRKNEALGIRDESKMYPSRDQRGSFENLKIMLWAINEIGSIEKAKKVFNAAVIAMESIEE